MRKARRYVIALALLLLPPTTAFPDTLCSFGVRFRPDEMSPVTLQFHDVPIRVLFGVIEKLTGTQFRVPPELAYRVTFDIRSVVGPPPAVSCRHEDGGHREEARVRSPPPRHHRASR